MNSNDLRYRQRWIWTPGLLLSHECETPHILQGVELAIFVDQYNVVTPFGRVKQEVPTLLLPDL